MKGPTHPPYPNTVGCRAVWRGGKLKKFNPRLPQHRGEVYRQHSPNGLERWKINKIQSPAYPNTVGRYAVSICRTVWRGGKNTLTVFTWTRTCLRFTKSAEIGDLGVTTCSKIGITKEGTQGKRPTLNDRQTQVTRHGHKGNVCTWLNGVLPVGPYSRRRLTVRVRGILLHNCRCVIAPPMWTRRVARDGKQPHSSPRERVWRVLLS